MAIRWSWRYIVILSGIQVRCHHLAIIAKKPLLRGRALPTHRKELNFCSTPYTIVINLKPMLGNNTLKIKSQHPKIAIDLIIWSNFVFLKIAFLFDRSSPRFRLTPRLSNQLLIQEMVWVWNNCFNPGICSLIRFIYGDMLRLKITS